MKIVNTLVSTGSKVKTMFNEITEMEGTIGVLKQGKISIRWKVNQTSGITEYITTRALNSRIKSKNIQVILE